MHNMNSPAALDEAPSQFRLITTLLLSVLLAAFSTPLLEVLRNSLPLESQSGWNAVTDLRVNAIYAGLALLLCAITWRSSGLGVGTARRWKRYGLSIAFAWIMPPLLVLSLYPALTYTPFKMYQWPIGWWLVGSVAQELLFGGFIYGRMVSIFGTVPEGFKGSFSVPLLVTAFLYALNHWPNIQTTEHGMTTSFVEFQFLYAFLGFAWMLNVRRWTDSIWLGILNHILVNWLATVI